MGSFENWDRACVHWRGRVLEGKYAHWCDDWDGLPVDETCREWPCACYRGQDGIPPRDPKWDEEESATPTDPPRDAPKEEM